MHELGFKGIEILCHLKLEQYHMIIGIQAAQVLLLLVLTILYRIYMC